MMRAAAVVLIAGAALDVHATDGSTPPERTAVLDNATATVTRLHFAPGAAESAHTHPYSLLIVQVTGGTVNVSDREMVRVGSRKSFAGERRSPRDRDQTRSPTLTGGAADGSAARDFPRDAARQRRGPGRPRPICADASEPVHAHPNDLLTIQITSGRVEILNGGSRSIRDREPGFVQFLPRNVPHAYASGDTAPFEMLSVSIK